MKEIKFRAWDKEEKRIVRVNGLTEFNDEIGVVWSEGIGKNISDMVLMQYTGLKDKNGKEIYEGDILQVPGAIPAQVYWDFGSWQLRNGSLTGGMLANFDEENIEIIGNIYENPELLK